MRKWNNGRTTRHERQRAQRSRITKALDERDELASKIAKEFCRQLRAELSSDAIGTIIDLNNDETNPQICHTHDFCDANMVMHTAMEQVDSSLVTVDAFTSDKTTTLWSMAWTLAKKSEFDETRIA